MKNKFLIPILLIALMMLALPATAENYIDGTYTVSAEGNNAPIQLQVVFANGKLSTIEVLNQSETEGLGDIAIEKTIDSILKNGSVNGVDTVNGATVSSAAVLQAVKAAYSLAEKGEIDNTEKAMPVATVAATFADQCREAGIAYAYEDPNADLYVFTSTDPEADVVTHASGRAKYVDETNGPCIKTPQDLAVRSTTKVKTYYWVEDIEKGVETLQEAALLEDARYMTNPFPNDGKKYSIKLNSSAVGTNTICTVNEDGMPTAAVFGMKYVVGDNGEDVYTSVAIMAETATYRNIMAGSPILITYYEYNPHSEKKIGIGARNAGARVFCEMDEELSQLTIITDAAAGTTEKITVAAYRAMDADAQAALTIKSITLKAKIIELNSIG